MSFSSKIAMKLMTSFHMVRPFAKRANPGLNYQMNVIEDAVEVIQSDPEGFEGLESDLFNAHKSHKEHELQQIHQREKVKRYLIKTKYFRRDMLPNMLTYAEKEQIRYLHSFDEEEWTVDKLADSFPANAEIISKIVKSDWTAFSSKRVRLHDASVMKNWERFKNGEYKATMPKELEEHLNKFANRSIDDMKISKNFATTFAKIQWQKPTSNEFSSIISTLTKKGCNSIEPITLNENKPKDAEIDNICLKNETYLQGEIKNKKPITIDELKSKHALFKKNENSAWNQLPTQKNKGINETGIVADKSDVVDFNDANELYKKFTFNEVNIPEIDKELYGISQTKQRIHIPRKLWRKSATYRVNNCYYDDDGELLYKVPGMFLQ